jgi:iron complex transport system substrate-binding protein
MSPFKIVLWLLLVIAACPWPVQAGSKDLEHPPQRIISIAPSLTETLFALGVGDKIRGVSKYCNYPEAARRIPRVGGYYDPNYEAILELRPDLAIVPPEDGEHALHLKALGIPTLIVGERSLAGVITSFLILGSVCQCEAQAVRLAQQFEEACQQARRDNAGRPRKKVLVVVGRDYGSRQIGEVYAVGRGELYDELLELAGGENVCRMRIPKYPKLSAEGILALHPDIVLELVDPSAFTGQPETLIQDWKSVPGLQAAQSGHIRVLTGDYLTIPGPRLLQALAAIRQAVQGEP